MPLTGLFGCYIKPDNSGVVLEGGKIKAEGQETRAAQAQIGESLEEIPKRGNSAVIITRAPI